MLKTLSTESAKSRKGGVGVGDDSRARRGGSKNNGSRIDNVEVDGSKVEVDEFEKKGRKTSKSKNSFKSKKTVGSVFFTPGARLAFTKLRQVFIKAPILHHFNPECHIRIETDISGYAISRVLN